MAELVRVVVVDDHPMVRAGLTAQLERDASVEVVGDADTVASALVTIAALNPDVVLVDHQLPDGTGLDVLGPLVAAGQVPAVVLVTGYDDRSLIEQYVKAGVAGFAHKSAGPTQLAACVADAAAGRSALDPQSLHRTLLAPSTPTVAGTLSAREIEVLTGVSQGLTNDAIGSRLTISSQTVKTHLSRIYSKLGVADRAQAAVVATRRGLL